MNIKVFRPVNRDAMPVFSWLGCRLLDVCPILEVTSGYCRFSVASWESFLHVLWRVYADLSRGCDGAVMGVPLRVVVEDYEAFTFVSFDYNCNGIRYTSLQRL